MPLPKLPIDFNAIRKALSNEVQRVTGLTCILEEPETQNAPRPPKPYFSFKLVGPAIKSGDDSSDVIGTTTTVWNVGGQRKVMVDFNTYGCSHEDAYGYMALWQSALETETTQGKLRTAGIAVWLNGSVQDISQLLNTAYEGRAHMEVAFGVAANIEDERGAIENVTTTGTVTTDQGETESLSVNVIAP